MQKSLVSKVLSREREVFRMKLTLFIALCTIPAMCLSKFKWSSIVTPASHIHVHYQLWQRCGYLYYKYKQNNHCYGERMTCNEQSVFQQQFAIAKYNPNYTIYYNSNHQVTLRLESYLHCSISVQFTLSMQTSKCHRYHLWAVGTK